MKPSDSVAEGAREPREQTAAPPQQDPDVLPVGNGHFRQLMMAQFGWLTSLFVHTALLLVLAFVVLPEKKPALPGRITMGPIDEVPVFVETLPLLPPIAIDAPMHPVAPLASVDMSALESIVDDVASGPVDPDGGFVEPDFDGEGIPGPGDCGTRIISYGPEGSDLANRRRRREQYTGTKSEIAVSQALRWLVAHQLPDGSWNFDHTRGACQGRCANPGSLTEAPRAATALGLMPFLGAGQTHIEGQYQAEVKQALAFLMRQMAVRGGTGSLEEPGGSMYAHGLGAIVLCEAYAMTRDRGLLQPAQLALNHIAYAQDPVGGGWRYQPRQPGDTSVFGWQFMALKSGHMAYLSVDPQTVQRAVKFLDGVQTDSGAHYGYTGPGAGAATTSVGLLCRMYAGWKHDHPALERGVQWIDVRGPSPTDMYYNYYATQVMRHYEGALWNRWDKRMQPQLLTTQQHDGHQAGSWYFADPHGGSRGGRLYSTALATMILEVYYRHLPIYQSAAVDEEFPL